MLMMMMMGLDNYLPDNLNIDFVDSDDDDNDIDHMMRLHLISYYHDSILIF